MKTKNKYYFLLDLFFKIDFKYFLFISLILYLLIFIIIYSLGWDKGWSYFGISAMYPPTFADARNIQGALLSHQNGLDPTVSNPYDPWGRELLYPKTWLLLASFLHLEGEINFLIFLFLNLLSYCFICIKLTKNTTSIFPFILSISSASLLCIERGNMDIFIFNLLYLAFSFGTLISSIIIVFASLLKIYPLVGLFLIKPGRFISYFLLFILVVFIYFYSQYLFNINNNLPLTTQGVFGLIAIRLLFSEHGMNFSLSFLLILTILSLTPMSIALSKGFKLYNNISIKELNLFLIGVGIYAGLFISSINFDYKLIFLILCIPFLSKLTNLKLKYLIYLLFIFSFNFIYLFSILGKYGVAISFISKSAIFFILVPMAIFEYFKAYHGHDFNKIFKGI